LGLPFRKSGVLDLRRKAIFEVRRKRKEIYLLVIKELSSLPRRSVRLPKERASSASVEHISGKCKTGVILAR
jgi:hypothetical protein